MKIRMQHGISGPRARRRSTSTVLAVVIVLVSMPGLTALARAQTYRVLHHFTGGLDGGNPASGRLVQNANGDLYGTAFSGGAFGCGVVFKIDSSGKESVLYSFTCGLDGDSPDAGLVFSSGRLYGTTSMGGENVGFFGLGGEVIFRTGALFQIDAKGDETVVHNFGLSDGEFPHGDLVQDAAGNFYGVTASSGDGNGYGTVFKMDAAGNATVLHSFASFDGAYPESPVVFDSAGNLYGTTPNGGDGDCDCGVVYALDSTGHETILRTFTGGQNGGKPRAGLLPGEAGIFLGTATQGGSSGGGIVFAVSTAGDFTVLHSFGSQNDGSLPESGLIRDASGNLYGTTGAGGTFGSGTVFELDRTGKETILHNFNGTDGSFPVATLRPDRAGNFYGTTENGGTFGQGVVFEITP